LSQFKIQNSSVTCETNSKQKIYFIGASFYTPNVS